MLSYAILSYDNSIGSGRNGDVKKVCLRGTISEDGEYALKTIMEGNEGIKEYYFLQYFTRLNHPNIIKLKTGWLKHHTAVVQEVDPVSKAVYYIERPMTCLFMLLELCETDANSYFLSIRFKQLEFKLKIMSEFINQMSNALDFLHSHSIYHLDFKPSNVLVKFDNGNPIFKLIDFDMSTQRQKVNPVDLGVYYYSPTEAFAGFGVVNGEGVPTDKLTDSNKFDSYSFGKSLYQLSQYMDGITKIDFYRFGECYEEPRQIRPNTVRYEAYTRDYKENPTFSRNPGLQWIIRSLMHCDPIKRQSISAVRYDFNQIVFDSSSNNKYPKVSTTPSHRPDNFNQRYAMEQRKNNWQEPPGKNEDSVAVKTREDKTENKMQFKPKPPPHLKAVNHHYNRRNIGTKLSDNEIQKMEENLEISV